jgi:subtilisin-like proprotein convertase family protein
MNSPKNIVANFIALPIGSLSLTPSNGFSTSGSWGGSFSPSSQTYTLQNTGGTPINWSVSKTQGWVTLSSTSGSLAAGASITLTVSINSNANSLMPGPYSDTVSFTNTTNGNGNTTRPVSLTVNALPPPPPSGGTARVEIDHTFRGDLVVIVGVGNVTSPSWSTVVSNQSGGSADNVYADVDISGGSAYLPPSNTNVWFLKVSDQASGDTGTIRTFRITSQGQAYSSTNPPVPVNDFQTGYAYIR